MLKHLMFLGLSLSLFSSSFGQLPCGNDIMDRKRMASNPRTAERKDAARAAWEQYNRALSLSKRIISGKDTSYEVPVVVHIVHLGGAIGTEFNPADTTIVNLIDYLNKTWAATWPTYADTFSGGTRVPVKFVLAKRNPGCAATTGINRVNGAVLSGYAANGICPFGSAPGPSDKQVKSLSVWPTQDYFNIWLVNKIEGGGVGGYAPWPWYAADLIDGAVIMTQYAKKVGSDYYSALPHELGHSFGLYHTFQDGCASGSCMSSGDEICDTEPHEFDDMDCDAGKINTCTGVLYNGVEYNFMNYSLCPNRFTKDQRTRAIYTLKQYRMGLVNSLGNVAPDASFVSPAAACTPGIIDAGNTGNVGPCKIEFANNITSSSGYYDDRATYLDRTCIQQAFSLMKGTAYPISISTVEEAQTVKVWIDYSNDGIFQPAELVFSHTGILPADEVHSGTVMVPVTGVVTNTNLRMRVMADILPPSSCSNVQKGQTEDYTVRISEKPTNIPGVNAEVSTFSIYPNPAADKVTMAADVPAVYTLYTPEGKQMMTTEQSTFSIRHLSAGIYFIRASRKTDGTLIGVQKLLKTTE